MIKQLPVTPEITGTPDTLPGLGASIAALRRAQQLPQQTCCEALGHCGIPMSSAALSRWENNSNQPGCYELLALSHALGQEGRLERFGHAAAATDPSDLPGTTGSALSDYFLREELRESLRRRPRMISFPVAENPLLSKSFRAAKLCLLQVNATLPESPKGFVIIYSRSLSRASLP